MGAGRGNWNAVGGGRMALDAEFIHGQGGGCGERVGTEKVWWDGAELKPGQIGRVTVVAPTELWLSNKAVKTLPSGAVYRVYALGGGYFGVGRGYGIKNDARVRYETPSREKLAAALCVQQAKTSMADVTMNGVAIGDSRAKVEAMYGTAKRKTKNAYGLYWEAYDQGGYKNFLMVSYDRDRVAAMYTNQPIVQTKKERASERRKRWWKRATVGRSPSSKKGCRLRHSK